MKEISLGAREAPIYRRHHKKKDGRDLFLFGYAPHTAAPVHEEEGEIAKGGALRWHPLRQEWNVYGAHRQKRTYKPDAAQNPLAPTKPGGPATEIPFSDFELAVFENKFPSFHFEAADPTEDCLADTRAAKGRCEVVVYTPQMEGSLATIGQDRRRLLLAAWIDRYEALFARDCAYVLPFESRGDEVGVTLHHPHGQIYGFPFVPRAQQLAIDSFAAGYDLANEIKTIEGTLHVASADDIIAFCPPFARYPFEVWIAPRAAKAGPWEFSASEADAFASLLGDITRRYDEYFQRPTAYMLALHAAPAKSAGSYHFTAQFYPILRAPNRVKYFASVEQHTGVFTVDVMPESAADILRAL